MTPDRLLRHPVFGLVNLANPLLMVLLYWPELVTERSHGDRPLTLTLLLLCNLHKTGVQSKVSLTVSYVTFIYPLNLLWKGVHLQK